MEINKDVKLRIGGRKAPKGGKDKLERFLDEYELYEWISDGNSAQFLKDCEKIDFWFENVMPATMHTTDSGVDFLSFLTGGDWEIPLLVILYWDGKKYRGYVPIKGNTINMLNKSAFGNGDTWEKDGGEDYRFLKSQGYDLDPEHDYLDCLGLYPDEDMCFEDFEARIEVI